MTPDQLTVLTCTAGHRCAKLFEALGKKPLPYDAGFLFGVEAVPVSSLDELAEALDGLRSMPSCMVIRDRLRADARPAPNGLFARRRVDRPNDPAPFEAAEHCFAMFDADQTATAFDPADPVGSVERWRATLPQALQGAAMVFQFSASQHLSPTVRGHAWVWLAQPVGGILLARWSTRNGLDPAVFHAVQPLYTADPLFAEGLADPLAPRALVRLQGSEAVELDFTEQDHIEGAALSQGGQRLGSIHLAEIGDPSDDPAASAARARAAQQLKRVFDRPGKRWDLCGHIGGACANAGVPPEECCAILEAIRAEDVPDYEFAQGLQWALGAYSFSARPLGLKGIAELTSKITADRVGTELRLLGELFADPPPTDAPSEEAEAPWGSLPLEEFDHFKEPEPIAYICEGLQIGPGKPTGIVAYANNSKTPYALELAVSVATGKTFHGHKIERRVRTLVVVSEGARNARRKLSKICKGHGVRFSDLAPHLTMAQGPPGFLSVEAAAELGERAIAGGFRMVVIDTYNSAFDGSADRNSNEFSAALKILGDISDRADVTFVVLLHTRKGDAKNQHRMPTLQDIDGHNSIAGALQAAIGLWRLAAEDKHTIGVCCIREVDAAFDTYTIKWIDTPSGDGGEGMRAEVVENTAAVAKADGMKAAQVAAEEETTRQLLQVLQSGSTTMVHLERKMATGLSREAKVALVYRLVREGLLEINAMGNGSQVITRAPRSPRAAEAAAKHSGFLAGGARGVGKGGSKV